MSEIFRYIGDGLHLTSMLLLLSLIIKKKSCIGISYRTQELFLIVFLSRYSELLFMGISSYYLFVMKIVYISLTAYTMYLMRCKNPIKMTYDSIHDNFPHHYTIIPIAILLTFIFHITFTYHPIYSYVWSFSIILEAFAMIPQLYMIRRASEIEVFSTTFIVCLGLYRFFYVVNWSLRLWLDSYSLNNSATHLEIFFGMIQTVVVSDFIIKYFQALKKENNNVIPI